VKLAELPDTFVLCNLGSPVETIALLRALHGGEIPGSDASLPVLVIGADDDHDQLRYYHAGAGIALSTASSPLVIAAALDALARRTVGEQRRRVVRVGRLTIHRLRRKVEHAGAQPIMHSIRGVGWRLAH
jgi:DNA-binding response OmpR family regulator